MIPLLTSEQIRQADAHTIEHEPVSSVNLMERAAKAFTEIFARQYPDKEKSISIYCGTGNNGGDGLAIARLLKKQYYVKVNVIIARFSEHLSGDFKTNLDKLKHMGIRFTELFLTDELPAEQADIIIDALLGSGLNKPLAGDYARLVQHLNQLNCTVVAVDVPTGLVTEGNLPDGAVVLKAKLVITFEQPKINFLLPDSAQYIGGFKVAKIGLNEDFIQSLKSSYQLLEKLDIKKIVKLRKPFEHKGTYGHALIIAGQQLTMGAALLCSSACAHAGAGLTTACIPESGLTALNTAHPEVMAIVRNSDALPNIQWSKFTTIAIGPGLSTQVDGLNLIKNVIANFDNPIVVDADALNLLAEHNDLLAKLPKGSIITPHMKEFDRLFGEHKSWWDRLDTVKKNARTYGITIVLKNRYTIIGTPDGCLYFNPTGNAAMGSGGMGDVLTGIIAALLAQKYTPEQACLLGVYLHGRSGDEMVKTLKLHNLLASQLAAHVPVVFAQLSE